MFFVVGGLARFLQVIVLPFVASKMGPADFGIFTLVLLYLTLGSALFLMGLEQALFRFAPILDETQLYRHAGSAFNFLLLLFGLSFPFFVIFDSRLNQWLFNGQFGAPTVLLLLFVFLVSSNTLIISKIKAQKHTQVYLRFMLTRSLIFTGLFVGLLILGLKLSAYFVALIVSELAVLLYQSSFVVKSLTAGLNRTILKAMLKYGFPLAVSGFLLILLYQFDHYLLKIYFGPKTTGIYNFAYKFAAITGTLILIANNVWMPRLFEKAPTFDRTYLRHYATLLLLGAGWVLAVILGAFSAFRHILVPPGFEAVPPLILIIGLGYLFFAHSQILDSIILKEKRSSKLMIFMGIALLLNIVLNLIYIPRYALTAAAWTTMLSMVVLWLLIARLVHRLRPDLPMRGIVFDFLALSLPFIVFTFWRNFFVLYITLFFVTLLLLKATQPFFKQLRQTISNEK